MRDIFESNKRRVEEDLLALGVRDAMLPPVFVPIPVVPTRGDRRLRFDGQRLGQIDDLLGVFILPNTLHTGRGTRRAVIG